MVWLAAVFVTNVRTALVIMAVVALITVDVAGLMWVWNFAGDQKVQFNAVFVVNLVGVLILVLSPLLPRFLITHDISWMF